MEGQPGVIDVERGWLGSSEINRVSYDPRQVSPDKLEGWLKKSGTYIQIVSPATQSTGDAGSQ